MSSILRAHDLRSVDRARRCEKSLGLATVVPAHPSRFVFEDVEEGGVLLRRNREPPPQRVALPLQAAASAGGWKGAQGPQATRPTGI